MSKNRTFHGGINSKMDFLSQAMIASKNSQRDRQEVCERTQRDFKILGVIGYKVAYEAAYNAYIPRI